jgi:hypothetical protein
MVPLLPGKVDLSRTYEAASEPRSVYAAERGCRARSLPAAACGGLNLADAVKDIHAALRDQAKHALENGESVPGWTLSAGRMERHWRDEDAARAALQNLGLGDDDITKTEMRSPKQVEIRAKARGLKVPQELIVSARSGVSLVKAENVRVPVLGRAELARMFSEALKAFQGGRQA